MNDIEAHFHDCEREAYGKKLPRGWYREEVQGITRAGTLMVNETGPFDTREAALAVPAT